MENVHECVKELKLRFRSLMNGVVSQSMRDKGVGYRVNFGVELPRLREMAAAMQPDHALAQALWKEDIRECRILATLLQPVDTFCPELAEIWVEQMHYPEEAECAVQHLFARLPYASEKAFEWIASEGEWFQVCGYLLLARLFAAGRECSPRSEEEFFDQAVTALSAGPATVSGAARKALVKFMDLSEANEERVEQLLASAGQ